MRASRWMVAVGALLIAALALYVLLRLDGGAVDDAEPAARRARPAMDDIDEASRERLRELLEQEADGS